MAMSGPKTEKVDPAAMLLPDGRSVDSGFFENIGRKLQERTRIDRLAVQPNFEVQVRAGGTAGAADRADQLAGPDRLAGFGAECRHVRVSRPQAIAVIDLDAIAVTGPAADEGHPAVGGGIDRRPGRAFEIEPGMEGRAAGKRVGAVAETGADVLAGGGNDLRDAAEATLQRIHPGQAEAEAAKARVDRILSTGQDLDQRAAHCGSIVEGSKHALGVESQLAHRRFGSGGL